MELQPGGGVYIVHRDGREGIPEGLVLGTPQNVLASGEEVFWEEWTSPVRWVGGSLDRPRAVVREVGGGDEIRSTALDGTDLAWLQAYGPRDAMGFFARLELWTSPFATSEAGLSPRMVRTGIPSQGDILLGGGIVGRLNNEPRRVELIDLADGRMRAWVPPDGETTIREPIYLSQEEMLVEARGSEGAYLMRLDPRTLAYLPE